MNKMTILTRKKQREILQRIAANHIIAKKTIDRLHETTEMSVEEYGHYMESLTDNTVRSSVLVAGMYGLGYVEALLKSKGVL